MTSGKKFTGSLWVSFLMYLAAMLLGTWLLFATLGISRDWSFQPIPPSIDSAALTSIVVAEFDGKSWYIFALFVVFFVLWFGCGAIFWGNASAKWRQSFAFVLGTVLLAYSFLLPYGLISEITGEASILIVYFLAVAGLALLGTYLYWGAARSAISQALDPMTGFDDANEALTSLRLAAADVESGQVDSEVRIDDMDIEALVKLADDALSDQESRIKGSVFSMLGYAQFVSNAQVSVQRLTSELRIKLSKNLNDEMNALNDSRFGEGMMEELINELIQEEVRPAFRPDYPVPEVS